MKIRRRRDFGKGVKKRYNRTRSAMKWKPVRKNKINITAKKTSHETNDPQLDNHEAFHTTRPNNLPRYNKQLDYEEAFHTTRPKNRPRRHRRQKLNARSIAM